MERGIVSRMVGSAVIALAFAVASPVSGAEEVRLCGSPEVHKSIMEPAQKEFQTVTGLRLVTTGTSTADGLAALLAGECDAAMSGETLAEAVAALRKISAVGPPPDLKGNVLGWDPVRVIIHPANPVPSLTREQVKGLFTGKITNWKDLGGDDAAVSVVIPLPGSPQRLVFQKQVMDAEPYARAALQLKTQQEEIETVMNSPEGIAAVSEGFVTLPEYREKVKVVGTPEVGRPFLLITKGEPSPKVKRTLEFFQGEGKKYVRP